MKLLSLKAGACAVCSVAPNAHARCAICEGSNQLVRVCAFCREWNKRHEVDWNDKLLDRADDIDVDDAGDEPTSKRTVARPLRDAMKPTRRRGRPRSARIDDVVIPELLVRRVRVLVARIDLEGRNRGTYYRWAAGPSRRAIARRAGCSQHAVDRRYHDYARAEPRDSRASSARRLTEFVE